MQVFLTFLLTVIYPATHLNGSDLRLYIREFKQPATPSSFIIHLFLKCGWLRLVLTEILVAVPCLLKSAIRRKD